MVFLNFKGALRPDQGEHVSGICHFPNERFDLTDRHDVAIAGGIDHRQACCTQVFIGCNRTKRKRLQRLDRPVVHEYEDLSAEGAQRSSAVVLVEEGDEVCIDVQRARQDIAEVCIPCLRPLRVQSRVDGQGQEVLQYFGCLDGLVGEGDLLRTTGRCVSENRTTFSVSPSWTMDGVSLPGVKQRVRGCLETPPVA